MPDPIHEGTAILQQIAEEVERVREAAKEHEMPDVPGLEPADAHDKVPDTDIKGRPVTLPTIGH